MNARQGHRSTRPHPVDLRPFQMVVHEVLRARVPGADLVALEPRVAVLDLNRPALAAARPDVGDGARQAALAAARHA